MTSKSNYESLSDSEDGEIKSFRSIDEIDGRTVYVDAHSSHQSHINAHQSHVSNTYKSQKASRSSRSQF